MSKCSHKWVPLERWSDWLSVTHVTFYCEHCTKINKVEIPEVRYAKAPPELLQGLGK